MLDQVRGRCDHFPGRDGRTLLVTLALHHRDLALNLAHA